MHSVRLYRVRVPILSYGGLNLSLSCFDTLGARRISLHFPSVVLQV
jgi:hypothetical protein